MNSTYNPFQFLGVKVVDGFSNNFPLRRWLSGNVHDGRSEEILRCHEENGQEKASQGHTETKGMK